MCINTVIVTGSQGCVGHKVCNLFLNTGFKVIGIDSGFKYNGINRQHDYHKHFIFIDMDVCNTVISDISSYRPSIVIDLAAELGGVHELFKNEYERLNRNLWIQECVLRMCQQMLDEEMLDRLIFASTSMVYENPEKIPTPEYSALNLKMPRSAYAACKLICEYRLQLTDIPYCVLRFSNVAGDYRGQRYDTHVIPDLIRKIRKGGPVALIGDGKQQRCFIHSDDVAMAVYLAATKKEAVGKTFNITNSNNLITIKELAEKIWGRLHDKPFEYETSPGFAKDMHNSQIDPMKAKNELDFVAVKNLDDILGEYIHD